MHPSALSRHVLHALLALATVAAVAPATVGAADVEGSASVGLDGGESVDVEVSSEDAVALVASTRVPDLPDLLGGDDGFVRVSYWYGTPPSAESSSASVWDDDVPEEALSSGLLRVGAEGRAVVGALGIAAVSAARWAFAGVVGLFSRIGRGEVLDNRARDAVYRAIQSEPGLSPTEIQVRLGYGWGTVVYHLDRLERNGYVGSERAGLARRYFATGSVDVRGRAGLALLKRPALQRLAAKVLGAPGLQQGELAATLGLSPSAAAKQLAQLEQAGLVRREREGKAAFVHPTPSLGAALPVVAEGQAAATAATAALA